MRGDAQLSHDGGGVGAQRVDAQRKLARLVVGGHHCKSIRRAQIVPPETRKPLWMGMGDCRLLGRVLAQNADQCRGSLARGPTQHGIDEVVSRASACLHQLDAVGNDRVVRRTVEVQQLIQAEPQCRQHGRVEPRGGTTREVFDHMIERGPSLDRAVGKAHRKRAVARVELDGLGLQRAIGVCALLEYTPQHDIGTAPCGRDWGTRGSCPRGAATGLPPPAAGTTVRPCPRLSALAHSDGRPCPRRKASAAIGRFPGGWTSSSSSWPSTQPSNSLPSWVCTPAPACAAGGLATAARCTPSRLPSDNSTRAPMCGLKARTTRSSSTAGWLGSSKRSAGPIFSAYVTVRSSCSANVSASPRSSAGGAQSSSSPPACSTPPASEAKVSSACMGSFADRHTGPLSRPAVRRMIETPVRASPAIIARSTGAAPRQRGSSDGCTLSSSPTDSSGSLISAPNAHTTTACGSIAATYDNVTGALTFAGCSTRSPRERARSATGGEASRRPRPRGRSGRVSTSAGRCESRSARRSRIAAAKSVVPRKTMLKTWERLDGAGRLLCLTHRAHRLLARLARDPVEDQDAVEMVDLVLDHARLKALGLDLKGIPFVVLRANTHARGTLDRIVPARQAEAALFGALALFALPLKHRID